MTDTRPDGRSFSEVRPIEITTGFMPHAEGSVLIKNGDTHVACSATVQHYVPPWLRGQRRGWVTAEYGMLPRSTGDRVDRRRAATGGRTREIERIIGRSLRSVTDLEALGERSIIVDCDVLRADGGTRTASITGGYVALAIALRNLIMRGALHDNPLKSSVAAISVGIFNGETIIDLTHAEDSRADVDMNVVMTGTGDFVEVQGTAEGTPFSGSQLSEMLWLAREGCNLMAEAQREALRGATNSAR